MALRALASGTRNTVIRTCARAAQAASRTSPSAVAARRALAALDATRVRVTCEPRAQRAFSAAAYINPLDPSDGKWGQFAHPIPFRTPQVIFTENATIGWGSLAQLRPRGPLVAYEGSTDICRWMRWDISPSFINSTPAGIVSIVPDQPWFELIDPITGKTLQKPYLPTDHVRSTNQVHINQDSFVYCLSSTTQGRTLSIGKLTEGRWSSSFVMREAPAGTFRQFGDVVGFVNGSQVTLVNARGEPTVINNCLQIVYNNSLFSLVIEKDGKKIVFQAPLEALSRPIDEILKEGPIHTVDSPFRILSVLKDGKLMCTQEKEYGNRELWLTNIRESTLFSQYTIPYDSHLVVNAEDGIVWSWHHWSRQLKKHTVGNEEIVGYLQMRPDAQFVYASNSRVRFYEPEIPFFWDKKPKGNEQNVMILS